MRQYHRIQQPFYRICIVSEKDSQTLALVPDAENAHLIMQLLNDTQRLREGQRIVSYPSVLRPESDAEQSASAATMSVARKIDVR